MNEQYNNSMWDEHIPPKRTPKNWGRIAVKLIIIGLLLFAVGWATGARGGRVYLFGPGGFSIVANHTSSDTTLPSAINLTAENVVHSLTVNASSGSIQLYATDSDRLQVAGSRRGITINEDSGHFYLDARNTTTHIGIIGGNNLGVNIVRGREHGHNQYTAIEFNFDRRNFTRQIGSGVRIYVPSSVQNIYAHTRSGSVLISDISTNQLHLQTRSGSVRLEGGTHANTHLETSSGGIRANGRFTGDITANTRSGSVRVYDYNSSQVNNTVRLYARSGGVRYYSSAPRSNFSYNLSVRSGSMRIDNNRLSGRDYSGGSGNSEVIATTRSGSIQLNFGR